MSTRLTSFAAALVLAIALPAGAQKIYKWVDEDGNIHYSDTPPPHLVDKEHKILNERGITVEAVDRAKTAEERDAEEQAAMAAEEIARLEAATKAEQERQDRILLSIYANEEDLFRARDHKLAAIDSTIELTRSNIATQHDSLEKFMQEAADMERRGEQVSPEITQAIDTLRENMTANGAFIVDKEQEKIRLRASYEKDLQRFRELTARRDNSQGEESSTSDPS